MITNPTPKPGQASSNKPIPSPKPGAKPGTSRIPGPGAMPGRRPSQGTARGAAPLPGPAAGSTPRAPKVKHSDPAQWGRVADDGSVYVQHNGQECLVGNWQAGTPAEGLAHYGQRYDDLATEIGLLTSRLKAHPEDAKSIAATATELRESLPTQAVVGDIAALERELDQIIGSSADAEQRAKEDKAQRRANAIARKDALASEAESLAESTEWKAAGDRLREILEEWKTIRGIDRKTDDALWKRYSRARDAFNRHRGSHFAELDRNRAAARRRKEELIEQAEAITDSTDWNETARAYRDLMAEWKKAGRAQRNMDNKLWARFKAAQDHFFDARNAVNHARDEEFAANARAKDALLAEYDPKIDPSENLDTARKLLHELQDKWEEIGYVPRGQVREYEEKIGKLEKRVSEAADAEWRRTDPEAQARASQFSAKVEEFTAQAEAAEAKGNAKKAADLRAKAAQWQEWADAAHSAVDNR